MARIAGVLYPDRFHASVFLDPMLEQFWTQDGYKQQDQMRLPQLQLGVCGGQIGRLERYYGALDGFLTHRDKLIQHLSGVGCPANADDTLVMLYGYKAWGKDCLKHFEGEFAFFIYDSSNERLMIAKDRIGKKPLYWYHKNNLFLFSSELKPLLASGAIPQTPSGDAIAAYLYFGFFPQDMTPVEGVNKLLPSYGLEIEHNHNKQLFSYWSYSHYFENTNTQNHEEVLYNVGELLRDSIKQQLPEQTKVGCLLPGRVGAACLGYELELLETNKDLVGLATAFAGDGLSEFRISEEIARTLRIPLRGSIVEPEELLEHLVQIVWCLDEPLADPQVIANYRLAQLARPTGVVLSSIGSEEIFAEYGSYEIAGRPPSQWEDFRKTLYKTVLPLVNSLYKPGVYTLLRRLRGSSYQVDYLNVHALLTSEELEEASPNLAHLFDPYLFLNRFYNLSRIKSPLSKLLYIDLKTRLPDSHILQSERLTTAFGVKWRTPFLSQKLVEYLASLANEADRSLIPKELLKNRFSENVLNSSKRTPKSFLGSWIPATSLSKLFDRLLNGTLVDGGIISASWLRKQLATEAQKEVAFSQLWGILILEIWFQLFFNRSVRPYPPDIKVDDLLQKK